MEEFKLTDGEIRQILKIPRISTSIGEYMELGACELVAKEAQKKLVGWEIAEMNKRWYELTGEPEVPMENALIDFKALLKSLE